MPSALDLASGVLARQRRAIARALTAVENGLPGADDLVDALYPHTGGAWRLGITGPPGAGKSTLTDRLVSSFRARGETVAVVAVDPSSPFTGGALLGDRVRLADRVDDDGVFVRSLAARGALGGLAEAAEAACDVFDAAGFDIVLLETVGVGQGEIDVAQAADTTLVVLVPESGDAVQAMKAGLMEVADVFCVNKADHPEAGAMVRALRQMMHLRLGAGGKGNGGASGGETANSKKTVTASGAASRGPSSAVRRPEASGEIPTVVKTSALNGDNIDGLVAALDAHRQRLEADREGARDARLRRRVARLVEGLWRDAFWSGERRQRLAEAVARLDAEERAPHALAARVLSEEA